MAVATANGSGDGSEDASHERLRAKRDARDQYLRSKCAVAALIGLRRFFLVPAERAESCWAFCAKRCRRPRCLDNARWELLGALSPVTATSKRYPRTRPNGERTTAVTVDTSPTSCDLANLALQPDDCSRQRGGLVPRTWLGSEKSTIYRKKVKTSLLHAFLRPRLGHATLLIKYVQPNPLFVATHVTTALIITIR